MLIDVLITGEIVGGFVPDDADMADERLNFNVVVPGRMIFELLRLGKGSVTAVSVEAEVALV